MIKGSSPVLYKVQAFPLLLETARYLSHHTSSVPQSLTYQQLESEEEEKKHIYPVFNNALV